MTFLTYLSLAENLTEHVSRYDIDPAEQAGMIDRTLIPVVSGAEGRARSRHDGYTVTGDIGRKRATLDLFDEGVAIARIHLCLHSRCSHSVWQDACNESGVRNERSPPHVPWVALTHKAPEIVRPQWLGWWAKTVSWSLIDREGW